MFNPNGTVTEYQYDGLGRVLMTTENAREGDETQAAAVRQTAYKYDDKGRLVAMAGMGLGPPPSSYAPRAWSQIVWDGDDPTIERTGFTYGAEVLDKGGNVISQHNGWIKEVHYPDPATGAPSETASLTFQYYSDGSVASREDEKGNRFVYHYDEQGRLVQTNVFGERWYATGVTARYDPPPSIKSILYAYTPDGLLDTVTAYDGENGGGNILSQNHFHYDALRHLTVEYQSHGAAVNESTTPAVEYVWDSSPQGTGTYNFDRLTGIKYPTRTGQGENGRREVFFDYGDNAGGMDSRLSRITAINDTAIHPSQAVAAYAYMGTSRRVSLTLGNVITQSVVDANGNGTGLDRYGRITNLQYMNGANTVHQYQYAYDRAGNRTMARVVQAPAGGSDHDNDRSYLYAYDHLQRLVSAHMGRIGQDEDENTIIVPDDPDVALRRELKWSLDALGNWTGSPFQPPSTPGLRRKDYLDGSETPSTTQSIKHTTDAFNQITAIKTGSATQAVLNDPAGNLIYDGQYVYQYDPWNRLVEVNLVGSLVYDPANPTTDDFDDVGKIQPGAGHEIGPLVVRFQYDGLGRLMLAQRLHTDPPGGPPTFRTEHYYYDGVRRLQEVDDNATPADTGDDDTQHEYVYGPDYVDEFVVETQKTTSGQQAFYILQDANYNVMALLEPDGDVVEQYQWEPYGLLATKDELSSPAPDNKIGHQGLFFYRFDTGTGGTLSIGAVGLYYNRNRWYSPTLGRFTSRDPAETAELIVSAAIKNAEAFLIMAGAFNAAGHFADGANLYAYEGSNPVDRQDPGGLEWWDDEIDNATSDWTGQRLYALGMINDMARAAGLGLRTAVSIAGSLLPGAGLYDAFRSVQVIADGSGGFWDAMNIAMAAFPLAKGAAKLVGMSSLFKTFGYAGRACNCFVAGTMIDTPQGERAIEELQPGDEVMTCPQDEPRAPPRPGKITRVFRNLAPVILWLSLANGQVVGTTPGHEVWTHQGGWTLAGDLQIGDLFIGNDSQPVEILSIEVDPTPTPVYNFEVDGTFTYYAAGVWVHNDSCQVGRQLLMHIHHALAKFLGGFDDGIKALLSETMHQRYHGGLLSRLAAEGIHKPRNMKWTAFFRAHPDEQTKALNVMMDYTRQFDAAQGTSLTQYVWKQIAAQWW